MSLAPRLGKRHEFSRKSIRQILFSIVGERGKCIDIRKGDHI